VGRSSEKVVSGSSRQSQPLFGTYSGDKAILSESDRPENYETLDERIEPFNLTNRSNTRSSLVSYHERDVSRDRSNAILFCHCVRLCDFKRIARIKLSILA
jgi:hypothetical protein